MTIFSAIMVAYGDETAYTLDTYPGHSLDTCDILHQFYDTFFINIQLFATFANLFRLLGCAATVTYHQLHRIYFHMLHLYSIPSYLQPIIILEIEVFLLISHGHTLFIVMHY